MECLFCRIIRGEIPSKKIYEDEYAVAFLDIAPWQEGHSLVVPRRHSENLFDDEKVLAEISPAIAKVGLLLREKLSASAVNVLSNAGKDAGQEVFHTHVHVVPRYPDGAGLQGLFTRRESDLEAVHARILSNTVHYVDGV